MKLSVEQALHFQPEGYQEPHNEGPKAHHSLARWWYLNENLSSLCVTCYPTVSTSPYEK